MDFVNEDGWSATGMLRFIERDGKNILQQLLYRAEGRRYAEWHDVPLVADDMSRTGRSAQGKRS